MCVCVCVYKCAYVSRGKIPLKKSKLSCFNLHFPACKYKQDLDAELLNRQSVKLKCVSQGLE